MSQNLRNLFCLGNVVDFSIEDNNAVIYTLTKLRHSPDEENAIFGAKSGLFSRVRQMTKIEFFENLGVTSVEIWAR